MFDGGIKLLLNRSLDSSTEALKVAAEALSAAKQALQEIKVLKDSLAEEWRRINQTLVEGKIDRDAKHAENRKSIGWLFSVIWGTALVLISILGLLVYAFLVRDMKFPPISGGG